jgi:hypothetical protein
MLAILLAAAVYAAVILRPYRFGRRASGAGTSR